MEKWKSCVRLECPKQHDGYLKKGQDTKVRNEHARCTRKKCIKEFDGMLAFYKKYALDLEKVFVDLIDKHKKEQKITKDPSTKRMLQEIIAENTLYLKDVRKIAKVKTLDEYYKQVSRLYFHI